VDGKIKERGGERKTRKDWREKRTRSTHMGGPGVLTTSDGT
jgi:hypothetical protein